MKQKITIDQLHELSVKQRNRLNKLTNCYDSTMTFEMTIGGMIQLLTEQKSFVHFTVWNSQSETKGINYHKIAIIDAVGEDTSIDGFEEEELCDALWNAVKSIL